MRAVLMRFSNAKKIDWNTSKKCVRDGWCDVTSRAVPLPSGRWTVQDIADYIC